MDRCLKFCAVYAVPLALGVVSCSGSADERTEATRAETERQSIRDTISLSKAQTDRSRWDEAAALIRHLPPSAFPEAPVAVRDRLIADGCSVPQAYHSSTPHNVISGEFAAPGQTDWAALCTRGDSAGIVIVWGGPAQCPAPIAWGQNRDALQGIGQERIGYSRAIAAANMDDILEHAKTYGGPPPPARDHSGIDDAFIGKASVVRFCSNRQWFILQGAD